MIRGVIVNLHEKLASLTDAKPADYIPHLAGVDTDQFPIAAFTTDGAAVRVGDIDNRFTIQSVSKLLTYGLALETHGRDAVLERVGVAPTGERFDAIVLDDDANRAPNPMVNAGANAWIESFNGRLRDEFLNGRQSDNLLEAQVLIEDWRIDYDMNRTHNAHGDLTPTEFARPGPPETDQHSHNPWTIKPGPLNRSAGPERLSLPTNEAGGHSTLSHRNMASESSTLDSLPRSGLLDQPQWSLM